MDWVYSKRTDLEGRTDQIRSINNKRIAIAHNGLCDISNTAVSYTSLRECRLGVSSAGFPQIPYRYLSTGPSSSGYLHRIL